VSGVGRRAPSRSTRYPAASKAPRVRERVASRLLLDTHAFLWWVGDDPRLSATARRTLLTGASQLFLSAASAWEIAVKAELGKLRFNRELESFMADHLQANRITALPVSIDHALYVRHLPNHHRDPFDRLLVAQSLLEDLPLVTGDRILARYGVKVVW
jgi:PIN domain nuclease of toxin-antitoxin system